MKKYVEIGKQYGTLTVLKTERRKENKGSREYAYCYCSKYHRWGWTQSRTIPKRKDPCGVNFPVRDLKDCDGTEDFIKQFPTWEHNKGYFMYHDPWLNEAQPQHNLIWRANNEWKDIPENLTIDHIDGNTYNNDISNLRLATKSQQAINRKPRRDKKSSKYIGVWQIGGKYKWASQYKGEYLGVFDSEELAFEARKNAVEKDPDGKFIRKDC
jgi:hypothetical protein